ncbi:hypothetical protein ACFYUH_36510 [Streptomyces fimicarius]|uniref:hypothetical protein n=1 Tax=Streptomyces griseus TaxID=1911 RepID=UPI00367BF1E1
MLNIAAADEETVHRVMAELGRCRATSGVAALRRDPNAPESEAACTWRLDGLVPGRNGAGGSLYGCWRSGPVRPWCSGDACRRSLRSFGCLVQGRSSGMRSGLSRCHEGWRSRPAWVRVV